MSEQKISTEKLEEEIRDGKTVKQIAHRYGYGYPSRPLNQRIRDLGYSRLSKFNFYSSGGANVSITGKTMDEALDKCGIERESHEDNVFYTADVSDAGEIVLTPKENGLMKNDE